MKIIILFSGLILFLSCHSKPKEQNPQKAKQLYSEGMEILDERISIQFKDSKTAMELNRKSIEKFSAAYNADTTLTDAAFFASECTMYGNDYQECLDWTTKLMLLDTTQRNISFCKDRIEFCNKKLSQ